LFKTFSQYSSWPRKIKSILNYKGELPEERSKDNINDDIKLLSLICGYKSLQKKCINKTFTSYSSSYAISPFKGYCWSYGQECYLQGDKKMQRMRRTQRSIPLCWIYNVIFHLSFEWKFINNFSDRSNFRTERILKSIFQRSIIHILLY